MITRRILVLILLLLLPSCSKDLPQGVIEEQNAAKQIIAAIDVYKKDTGRYPFFKMSDAVAGLEELVPKYLSDIPKTTQNQDYYYWSDPRVNDYTLGFDFIVRTNNDVSSTVFCSYTASTMTWLCQNTILQQVEGE